MSHAVTGTTPSPASPAVAALPPRQREVMTPPKNGGVAASLGVRPRAGPPGIQRVAVDAAQQPPYCRFRRQAPLREQRIGFYSKVFQDGGLRVSDPLADRQQEGSPASTAQAVSASTTTRACRMPRGSRGSGTSPRRSSRPGSSSGAASGCWRSRSKTGGIGDDASAGTVFHSDHGASRTPRSWKPASVSPREPRPADRFPGTRRQATTPRP